MIIIPTGAISHCMISTGRTTDRAWDVRWTGMCAGTCAAFVCSDVCSAVCCFRVLGCVLASCAGIRAR
eukprot:3653362-Pyramimonas_sp.AAC.1